MIVYTAEKFIKEGTSIGIFSTREPKHICLHRHDFIEIVYISSGTATEYVRKPTAICSGWKRNALPAVKWWWTSTVPLRMN